MSWYLHLVMNLFESKRIKNGKAWILTLPSFQPSLLSFYLIVYLFSYLPTFLPSYDTYPLTRSPTAPSSHLTTIKVTSSYSFYMEYDYFPRHWRSHDRETCPCGSRSCVQCSRVPPSSQSCRTDPETVLMNQLSFCPHLELSLCWVKVVDGVFIK